MAEMRESHGSSPGQFIKKQVGYHSNLHGMLLGYSILNDIEVCTFTC